MESSEFSTNREAERERHRKTRRREVRRDGDEPVDHCF